MTIIIAEVGVNHDGSIEKAYEMVDAASYAGADIVKFQTFKADNLVTEYAKKADYQFNENRNIESQYEMLKRLELTKEDHLKLIDYCKEKNIEFFSSAFDLESIEFLDSLKLKRFKIPSGEITNLSYLRKIASYGKEVILSTGMSDMNDIKYALDELVANGTKKEMISVLHCSTEYPTPMHEVNLKAMLAIKDKFDVQIGYSDHTEGIEVSIAAVAMGANIIEKHITLNKNSDGPDHSASTEPEEFKKMVCSIRNIEVSLGDGIKAPTKSEQKNMLVARKSIVAAKEIKKDEILTEENLSVKRPGSGISPMQLDTVIGTPAIKNFTKDEMIVVNKN